MTARPCERNACPQIAAVLVGDLDTGAIEALCSAHALVFYGSDLPAAPPEPRHVNALWLEWTRAHQRLGAKDLTAEMPAR